MNFPQGKKAICIVAHPDDETIWMGGTILKNPQLDWTIFSLCRASDENRAPKFKKVCDYYGAKSIIADLDDESEVEEEFMVDDAVSTIKRLLGKNGFNYVFTHGRNGEYGHDRHVVVHEAVNELYNGGYLNPENIYFFNYKKMNENEEFSEMIPGYDSDLLNELDEEEYEQKRYDVMAGIYGFDPDGPDARFCTRIEAFKSLL